MKFSILLKYFFFIFLTTFLYSCGVEYGTNGLAPTLNDPVEKIFADEINYMPAEIKMEFFNESYRSISATYGENSEIFFQIILITSDISAKDVLIEHFMPYFEDANFVRKNVNGLYAVCKKDDKEIATWFQDDCAFLMIAHKNYVELAIENSFYLTFK